MGKKASKQKGLNALKRQKRKKLFVGGININLNDIALPDNTVEDVKGNTTDNSSTVTTGNLQTAVDAAASKLDIPDFNTLQQQIKTLESKVPQAYDDKDLRESIKANKESFDNINYDSFKYDDTNILAALQANSEALENIPEAFNPAGLEESIKANADALSNFKAPTSYDDSDILKAIKANEEAIGKIDEVRFDPSTIQEQIQELSNQIQNAPLAAEEARQAEIIAQEEADRLFQEEQAAAIPAPFMLQGVEYVWNTATNSYGVGNPDAVVTAPDDGIPQSETTEQQDNTMPDETQNNEEETQTPTPSPYVAGKADVSLLGDNPDLQTKEEDIQTVSTPADAVADVVTATEAKTSGVDTVKEAAAIDPITGKTYTEAKAGDLGAVEAAAGAVSKALEPGKDITLSERAKGAKLEEEAMKAALARGVDRPDKQDYAKAEQIVGVTKVEEVAGPGVDTRVGQIIGEEKLAELRKIAEGQQLPIEDLPEYKAILREKYQQGDAQTKEYIDRLGTAPSETAAQADFIGAGDVGAVPSRQIDQFGVLDAAGRVAQTGTAVAAPDAAEMAGAQAQAGARTATTGEAGTMEGQQTDLEDLPGFDIRAKREGQTGEFATRQAQRIGVAPEEIAAQAEYYGVNPVTPQSPTNIEELPAYEVAAKRQVNTAEAAKGIASKLGQAPSVDLEGRKAILGQELIGDAAQIGGIPTAAAASMQAVTGSARTMAAADMMGVVADIPPEVTAALSEDPAIVVAQLDENAPPEVTAAVAALPEEALVSVQMGKLLEGMEEGKTPA